MTSPRSLLLPCIASIIAAALNYSCMVSRTQGSTSQSINGQAVTADSPIAASTVGLVWDAFYDQDKDLINNGTSACSGTLIDRLHVLTAAHCFDPYEAGLSKNWRVTFGVNRTLPNVSIPVASYVTNSDYIASPVRLGHFSNADLVVITLASPAPASASPVDLLTANDNLQQGDPIIVAGFGVTEWSNVSTSGLLHSIQQHLDAPPTGDVPSVSYSIHSSDPSHADSGIACYGDSGGPVYVQRDGRLSLAAVVSSSTGYRCTNGRADNTDVRPLNAWIKRAASGQLAAGEGFIFPIKFTDTDGVVYPFCRPYTAGDPSSNYLFGIDHNLGGPDGKCRLTHR